MLNSAMLIVAVSIDVFIVSISCGVDGIRIPFKSALVVGLVGTLIMTLSLCFSNAIHSIVPSGVSKWVSFGVLCSMGIVDLVKCAIEHSKRDSPKPPHDGDYSLLDIYVCGSCADCDRSKDISTKEAVSVALLTSIDTLLCGMAIGTEMHIVAVSLGTLLLQTLAVWLGSILGQGCHKVPNVEFLGGLLLVVLGISRVV